MRRSAWSGIGQDVWHGLRGLKSSPAFTLGVTLSVAVGIAANTLAFSVLNAAFLRPFPAVHAQEELARIGVRTGARQISSTFAEYQLLKQHLTGLSDLAASIRQDFAVRVDGQSTALVDGEIVTANYFDVLGIKPAAGRFFTSNEDDRPWQHPAVVIGFGFWQRQFQGAADVTSRQILVNGVYLPIVGVTPKRFSGVVKGEYDNQLWITMAMSELALRTRDRVPVNIRNRSEMTWMDYVGRRKPGVTTAQVRAEAPALAAAIASGRPARLKDVTVSVRDVYMNDRGELPAAMVSFLALPMLVLMIACANAANLILARATQRGRDWIMRLALGASQWRVVRQMLVESLLLASAGSLLGLLLTYWGVGLVPRTPIPLELTVDWPVLVFTVAVTVLTAVLFGLGPALAVMRSAGRGRIGANKRDTWFGSRTRASLVALQAALCIGLIATGAQFARTAATLVQTDGVEHPDRFLIALIDVDRIRYTPEQADEFFARALARVQALPGVTSAALATSEPWGSWDGRDATVWMPGQSSTEGKPRLKMYAGGDLFVTLGLPIVAGRDFTSADRAALRSVIVNRPFADRYLGGNALGSTFRIADATLGTAAYAAGVDVVVVGVVAAPQVKRSDSLPVIYHPVPLGPTTELKLFARFNNDGGDAVGAIRNALWSLEPRLALDRVETLTQMRSERQQESRWMARAIVGLGVLALLLAAVGLYGVVSYMVTMRNREIGIRMALGSARAGVIRLVLWQSLRPAIAGCVVGAIGSFIVAMIVRSRLYGSSAADPVALAGTSALVILTLVISSVIPARRAASIDPVIVLRQD